MDDIKEAIAALTDRVIAFRVCTVMVRDAKMPLIEIKGLGADIANIKAGIAGTRAIAKEVGKHGAALRAELGDLRDQLVKHRDDLRFEAETLGNSSSESEEQQGSDSDDKTDAASFHKPGAGNGAK